MLYCLGESFKKMTEYLTRSETSYIEIVDDGFHTLDKRKVAILKNIGESYNLKYSIHAPFADINIASPSALMLKAMLKRLRKSIANAHSLDAYMWIFHPGLKTGVSMFYPHMDWLQNLKTIKLLLKIARGYDMQIAVENMPEPYSFLMKSVENFQRFYDEVDENIGMVFDVGHANINGQTELFLKTFSEKIVHVHAHDNNGKDDRHLGIGYGTADWRSVANLLKKICYDKVVIIESVEHIHESMQRVKQLLA